MILEYENTVKLLTSSGKFYINLGLERIASILNNLGNPQDNLKYIHVAGTNGKGSVCAMLASILDKAGMKVGLYTSPHIYEYTERIKINGDDISKDDFAKYVNEVCNLSEKENIHLTEFEILTAVMFKYFSDKKVKVVILETGLGGRFDATNVIKNNLCSIITHIDLDHTERLGNTHSKIAFEKAGIIKPECPVITSEKYEEIQNKAEEGNSLLIMAQPVKMELALKGLCQQENLSLVLAALKLIFPEISVEVIAQGLKTVKHPARFQVISDYLIVDGCHNVNGIKALRESLDFYFPGKTRRFVFGCLNNKNYNEMMKILFSSEDEIYFHRFNNKNSCTFEELRESCEFNCKKFESLEEFEHDKNILTVVCGSIYMIGEIIPQSVLQQ